MQKLILFTFLLYFVTINGLGIYIPHEAILKYNGLTDSQITELLSGKSITPTNSPLASSSSQTIRFNPEFVATSQQQLERPSRESSEDIPVDLVCNQDRFSRQELDRRVPLKAATGDQNYNCSGILHQYLLLVFFLLFQFLLLV